MSERPRTYLFLQGPISPYFQRLAERLTAADPTARALRINLCFGDRLFWRRPGAVDYRGKPEDWPRFVDDFIATEGVTDVLLLGEQRDYHRAAAEAARRHGAQVIATDFGYLRPDWITFELDGLTGASRFPRGADEIRALAALSPEPDLAIRYRDPFWRQTWKDIVYHLGASLAWPLYPRYRSHQPDHPVATYLGTGLRLLLQKRRARRAEAAIDAAEAHAGQTFVLPLQIERDFSLRAYSPFPDLASVIRDVVGSFARCAAADARLVIKVHPLDPGLKSWKRVAMAAARAGGVEDRVVYIDGGDLARLIRASAGVVVVNSTVGMLSLQLGAPTITLGRAIYDVPGMTAGTGLDAFWQAPAAPDAALVADFVKAVAATVLVRGTYYSEPGLTAAVEGSAARLLERAVNRPLVLAAE